jgi:hypothetical protein
MTLTKRDAKRDALGHAAELESALADPVLAALEPDASAPAPRLAVNQAAFRVAAALGSCRLCGVELPETLDGTLPPRMALAAGEMLEALLDGQTREAANLSERWDHADWFVGQNLAAELLEVRMEAWAAAVAMDEARAAASAQGLYDDLAELDRLEERLFEGFRAFDAELQSHENLVLLASVTEMPLLANWRALLADEYRSLPWWLDGTLERLAEGIE